MYHSYLDLFDEYDVSKIEPTVAYPHLPENTHTITEEEALNRYMIQLINEAEEDFHSAGT